MCRWKISRSSTLRRSGVPTHHYAFAPEWQRAAGECDTRADHLRKQTKQRHDRSVHPLLGIGIGSKVDIQNSDISPWDHAGESRNWQQAEVSH